MNDNQNELLQKAIAELKNSPTVDIKGKSYTQVSTRINPDYAIEKVHSWLFYNYRL